MSIVILNRCTFMIESQKGFTNLQDFYSYTLKTTDKMMNDLSNAYSDLDTPEEGFFTLGTADLKVIKNAHAHAIAQLTILNLKNKALKAISKSLTNSCSQK